MRNITITITADEDDLRRLADVAWVLPENKRVGDAIAAALPKPRIHPQPGDVLRRKRDRRIHIANEGTPIMGPKQMLLTDGISDVRCRDGLNPDEWEILTAAEIAEAFDRKRGA